MRSSDSGTETAPCTLIIVRVAQPAETEAPRFEVSVAMIGYVVLLVLLLESLARHLSR